jgi:transposase
MAGAATQHGCRRCDQRAAEIAALREQIAALEAELAKARKNSSNSSKPPSSDIVKPPIKAGKRSGQRKRKRGGQPGHPRHERTPFNPDQVDVTWEHFFTECPCCGEPLESTDEPPKILQQVELKELPIQIIQHERLPQFCGHCNKTHLVPWPDDLRKAGLIGPRLTVLVGFMKSACHMSFSTIRKFLRDVVGVTVSRGLLRKIVSKVTDSLRGPYEQLLDMLPKERALNIDETGHKENGARLWTWCFRAAMFTVYKISPSRGSDVILEVLGEEFEGVIGCDYFGAYRKYMRLCENVILQFCLAHFIRDVKFLAEHPSKKNREHGQELLAILRQLFRAIHCREQFASEASFQRRLREIANDMYYQAVLASPGTREADNLGNRFAKHFEYFFTFITTPGIECTNNVAERALRFVAIHRRITQGTRGESGRNWCERIWTVIATCEQQGLSVFNYLHEAVVAYFDGRPARVLVNDTS